MAKFADTLNKVKEHIKTLMTKDGISDEELNDLTELNGQVDELDRQHQELSESHSKMKDKYIEAITQFGTTKAPKDEEQNSGAEKTFEQIAKEQLSKDKK